MATDMLTEDLLVDVETLDEDWFLGVNQALYAVSPDGIRSEWDWMSPSETTSTKALPYSDQASLENMHKLGFRLYRDPQIQSAIEVLISYVVAKGWLYSVGKQEGQTVNAGLLKAVRQDVDWIVKEVSLGRRRGWYYVNCESYRRYLRDGEYFRKWFVRAGQIDIRFVEVFDIRQPPDWRSVVLDNPTEVPEWILQAANTDDDIPGELGIVSEPGDAALEIGYWQRHFTTSEQEYYRFVPASRMQHDKCNVDENDPRGIPAFYDGTCILPGVNLVIQAMDELAIKQSRYAVVHKHRSTNRREAIERLRQTRTTELNDQVSMQNREPYETHLKNVDIEYGGMKTQARNYVEVIQQGQRLLGNIRQVPEYMITNDANTGNRSSLQSAESPFGRRVARDQKDLWFFDRQLIWNILTKMNGWSVEDARINQRKMALSPTPPLADTRDRFKDAQMVVALLKARVISLQQACRMVDVDYTQMQHEIDEAPIPDSLAQTTNTREPAQATA